MAKAIYTVIDDKVYKLNQSAPVPTSLNFKMSGTTSSVKVDSTNSILTQSVSINNLQRQNVKSNSELYNELVNFITDYKITEIENLENKFTVYIDYAILENGKEIERSAAIQPVEPLDQAVLLGVAMNSECVYRRVKSLKYNVELALKNSVPMGIMNSCSSKKKYSLQIYDIAIFEDLGRETDQKITVQTRSKCECRSSIRNGLANMVMIYSTSDEGIDFELAEAGFMPRKMVIAFDAVLADFIVAYDDREIEKLITENIKNKYEPDDPYDPIVPDPDDPVFPPHDDHPDADGDFTPDDDGYVDWYERCTSTTPHGLLVVEDLMPDSQYDPDVMIRKHKVIKDIRDIEVGEFVIYRESYPISI